MDVYFSFVHSNRTGDVTYSGLYVYQTLQKEWTCLQPDYRPSQKYTHSLLPRMDHAMFFEKVTVCFLCVQ